MDTPSTQLLKNKRAVIFGAGGAVGTAVAKEFAAQGATVFLSGRALNALEQVAEEIQKDGGVAYAAEVDALDEQAVHVYLDRVAKERGSVDILLNAMGPQAKDYGNGTSTMELPLEQFLVPLTTMVPSQFITARAAARHMVRQHTGVILFLTSTPARGLAPNVTAIGTAFGAVESLLRCLAVDLGQAGVRVVGIRYTWLAEATENPEARYTRSESVSLAFLTVLQLLPPRQRAILILSDVLDWHASEIAQLLELSV
jgi:3-oxoacyl-[acyl-carrier protein] reductase